MVSHLLKCFTIEYPVDDNGTPYIPDIVIDTVMFKCVFFSFFLFSEKLADR